MKNAIGLFVTEVDINKIPHPARTDDYERFLWMVCVLVAAIVALLLLGPDLFRFERYEDDAAQHLFWMYRFIDPSLFPGDITAEYFSTGSNAPIGYTAFYALITRFFDPLAAAEWLAVGLLAVSMFLLTAIVKVMVPERPVVAALIALSVFAVAVSQLELMPTAALQRSVALPLILLMLWALMSRRYLWVGWTWLAAAVTYPVIVPVMGLVAGICFLRDLLVDRKLPSAWFINGLLGMISLIVIFLGAGDTSHFGPSTTIAEALQMPEFSPGGREELFGRGWGKEVVWLTNHRTGLGLSAAMLFCTGAALSVLVVTGTWKKLPFPVIVLALTGGVLWLVARYMLFDLYLPNRHSRWAVNIASILVITLAVVTLLAKVANTGLARRLQRSKAVMLGVACIVVTAASLGPGALARWTAPVDQDLERAYEYLAGMPKDTLIAGHPDVVDFVPLRTRRSVLVSSEVSTAFKLGYYRILKPRLEASLRATYATSWSDFDAALAPYGVDVFLVHRSVLQNPIYLKAFATLVRRLVTRGQRDGFITESPPAERVIFRSGDVLILSVGAAKSVGGGL